MGESMAGVHCPVVIINQNYHTSGKDLNWQRLRNPRGCSMFCWEDWFPFSRYLELEQR